VVRDNEAQPRAGSERCAERTCRDGGRSTPKAPAHQRQRPHGPPLQKSSFRFAHATCRFAPQPMSLALVQRSLGIARIRVIGLVVPRPRHTSLSFSQKTPVQRRPTPTQPSSRPGSSPRWAVWSPLLPTLANSLLGRHLDGSATATATSLCVLIHPSLLQPGIRDKCPRVRAIAFRPARLLPAPAPAPAIRHLTFDIRPPRSPSLGAATSTTTTTPIDAELDSLVYYCSLRYVLLSVFIRAAGMHADCVALGLPAARRSALRCARRG
jgi:hypothetical protein